MTRGGRLRKTAYGVLVVVGIACAWVGSTQLAKSSFSASFNGIFFSVWYNTAWLVLTSATLLFRASRSEEQGPASANGEDGGEVEAASDGNGDVISDVDESQPLLEPLHASVNVAVVKYSEGTSPSGQDSQAEVARQTSTTSAWASNWHDFFEVVQKGLARRFRCYRTLSLDTMRLGHVVLFVLPFTALWLLANYLYVNALTHMTPTDVTAVFSATPTFVYLLSMAFLGERFTIVRALSVLFTVAGVVVISLGQKIEGVTAAGVLLTIAASICAAVYKVAYKVMLGDATVFHVSAFLTVLATLSILFAWPVWTILQVTGSAEAFQWKDIPWAYMSGGAGAAVAFNFLVNFGVAYTFPLFISLGTVVGIPLNAVVDVLFHGVKLGMLEIIGCVCVCVGFLIMLIPVHRTRHTGQEVTVVASNADPNRK